MAVDIVWCIAGLSWDIQLLIGVRVFLWACGIIVFEKIDSDHRFSNVFA